MGLGFCLGMLQFDHGKAELEKQETNKAFAARILHVIQRISYQSSSAAAPQVSYLMSGSSLCTQLFMN